MLRTLSALPALLLGLSALAQTANKAFDKENIPDGDLLKRGLAAIREADALARKGGVDAEAALFRYSEAYGINPDNAELNMKIGLCHLNGVDRYRSLSYFEKALALDPTTPRIHFLLGYAYQLNARWDEAIKAFEVQRGIIQQTPDPERMYNMADKHIAECRNGLAFSLAPTRAQVRNLGHMVNGPMADYGAAIGAKGDRLYFTSRRGLPGAKVNKATNEHFESIYACERTPEGWSAPVALPAPVNSAFNDACVGVADEGRSLLVFRDEKGHGDLFMATQREGVWNAPAPLGPQVNGPSHEGSAWTSPDGQWLYFSSDRPGGLGGMDIWRSPWDATTEQWGTAQNLGPDVNTIYDEDGVFVAADGHTLYFGSQGHNTIGGYDIFRTRITASGWSKPENLGWPVNSPDDELYFVLSADGRTGIFSSVRPDGFGQDDLYQVDLAPQNRDLLVSAGGGAVASDEDVAVTMVRGFIKDLRMMEPLEAYIEVTDVNDAAMVFAARSNKATGAFEVAVPAGRQYSVHVRSAGHLLHSGGIDPATAQEGGHVNVTLTPAEAGGSQVLKNILWRNNTAELDDRSLVELAQVLTMLREQPALRLEVAGHTDNTGGEAHNLQLSDARAKTVRDHLVANGIRPERLEAKGYGSSRPVMPNDNEEHRAINRRTEIRVL